LLAHSLFVIVTLFSCHFATHSTGRSVVRRSNFKRFATRKYQSHDTIRYDTIINVRSKADEMSSLV